MAGRKKKPAQDAQGIPEDILSDIMLGVQLGVQSAAGSITGKYAGSSIAAAVQLAHAAQSAYEKKDIMQKILLEAMGQMLCGLPQFGEDSARRYTEQRDAYIGRFMPYLEKELEAMHRQYPETAGITAGMLDSYFDLTGSFDDKTRDTIATDPALAGIIASDPVLSHIGTVFAAVDRAKKAYTAVAGEMPELLRMKESRLIPLLQSRPPRSHTMPINRLANELQHDIINSGQIDLIVANRGKKSEITSYVLATYDQPDGITMTGRPYTEYDRQVQDAVSSLWEYGDESHIVTPDMVFRAMTHRTHSECPSPKQIKTVTESLEKMRRIHITVDATEELRKRGLENVQCRFDDYLLSLRAVEVRTGERTVKAYLINTEPVLLTYAKLTRQLATVPGELLDVKEVDAAGNITAVSIANNDSRIAVRGYLLRRIAVMRHDRRGKTKQSNIIRFDSVFQETGISKDSNAANVKRYIIQVLDFYKASGYISGYQTRKKGTGIDAVCIEL